MTHSKCNKLKMNRREFHQLLGSAGLGVTASSFITSPARAADEAIFITWGGYEEPGFHTAYLEKHGASPRFSLSGDEDEMFQKVRAGFAADLAHPTTANTQRWKDAGLSQMIDTSGLTEWANVFPALKEQPGVGTGEHVLSMPFDWGRTSVIYRTDKVELDEESYGILWDERYKGRIAVLGAVDDLVPITAMYAGYDPYNLTVEQEEHVLELIKEQKSLLRFYTDDMTTIQQALASGEIVAALAWDAAAMELAANGIPVRFMQPKEGVLTWLGGVVMMENANTEKAYDLLNALLDPRVGDYLINGYGYGHSNAMSYKNISDEQLSLLQLPRDPTSYLQSSSFLRKIPNKSQLALKIAEIKAAP